MTGVAAGTGRGEENSMCPMCVTALGLVAVGGGAGGGVLGALILAARRNKSKEKP